MGECVTSHRGKIGADWCIHAVGRRSEQEIEFAGVELVVIDLTMLQVVLRHEFSRRVAVFEYVAELDVRTEGFVRGIPEAEGFLWDIDTKATLQVSGSLAGRVATIVERYTLHDEFDRIA